METRYLNTGLLGRVQRHRVGATGDTRDHQKTQRRRSAQRCLRLLFLITLVVGVPIGRGATAPTTRDAAQWLSYGRDYTEQRFSPLTDINDRSVGRLGLKWTLELPKETALVSTPLMVRDTLYFTGKFSVVYAVSAQSGKIKWIFDPQVREHLAKESRRMTANWGTSRGLGYWDGKIIVAATDGRLIAVSARNGKPIWSAQTLDSSPLRSISGAPLVYKGKILIGNAGGDWGPLRGYVTAYDANDGRQLWRFYTVPGDPSLGFENRAMELASKTWSKEWWKYAGGGAVWNSMTFDREFNRVYIGTGNGAPWNDTLRGRAGGDNLFVASIIALDADTGNYAWHYQVVPGDNWDFDAAVDLVLADLEISGAKRKVLMQASKDGFFYVLDRETGKLISAEPFVHTTWAERIDLATGRPIETPNMHPVNAAIMLWPSGAGGHSWPSMSFSPETNFVYIPALDLPQSLDARGIDQLSWMPKTGPYTLWSGYSDIVGHNTDGTESILPPIETEAAAWLQARDPRTNKTIWQVKQPGLWAGGTLATAGHLVFIGQANGHLVAYDAGNGKELWSFNCGRPITAPPISYEINGIQYVAILVGWGGSPGTEGSLGDPALRMGYRDGGRRMLAFALNGTESLPISPVAPGQPIDVPGFSPDSARVQRGQQIFDMTCNNCHGTNARSGGGAPDLRASAMASDLNTLKEVVLHGALQLQGMPRYVDLTAENVTDLYHYIRFRARQDLQSPP